MSKHRWRESLQSLCENHTDPEEDEQLKLSKIEIQNKVSKALKLANERRHNRKNRNGEGNSRRESELSQLVEDFNRQYQLIYDLHFNLRRQLSQTYNDITEEGFYTASSDSEPEASEDNFHPNGSHELVSRNQEVEDLKQKLTCIDQEKESLNIKNLESLSKIEELENESKQLKKKLSDKEGEISEFAGALEARKKEALVLMKDLEAQVESLKHEKGRLIKQTEYESKAVKKMQMKESDLEALVLSLKKAMEDKEEELSALHPKVKGLESELNGLEGNLRELEEQLLRKDQEKSSLQDEVDSLQGRLQNVVIEYEKRADSEKSAHTEINQLNSDKGLLEGRILDLEKQLQDRGDEVNHLRQQVEEMNCEREKCQENLSVAEKQNTELTSKITDQQSVLNHQEDTINRLQEECKVAKSRLLQAADRKMEEMAVQFKKSLEATIMILRQRIRVAEQVQTENKESFKSIKERCWQEQMQQCSEMIATSKAEITNFFDSTNELFNRLDYQVGEFSTRISRVLDDITVMKNWNKEMKPVKDECTIVSSKEAELEKRVVEKEEEVIKLGEEKKETIRQLCMSVEYHKNRCDQLIKLLSKSRRKC
ncbi:hypothetical protein V2J09_022493 [Rumex salicifolius]